MSKGERRRDRHKATLLLMGFAPAGDWVEFPSDSMWWRYGGMKGGVRPTHRGILMGPTFLDEITGGGIGRRYAERVTIELKEFVSLWEAYLEKQSGS